jgi:tetratricopeptide (TPR) repeat protein
MKNFPRVIILTLLCALLTVETFAQSTVKNDKKYQKAVAYYQDDKVDKAIETLQPLLKTYENESDIWDAAMAFYFKRYQKQYKKEQTELTDQLMKSLSGKKKGGEIVINISDLSQDYLSDYINICYKATLKTTNGTASMYLRKFLVDPQVDTAVSKEAKELFNQAEASFQKQDYGNSLKLYEQAIGKQPDYYQATLYKGDAYYFLKEYKDALIYFKKAADIHPDLLEPRKYITDAYGKLEKWEEAADACIDAIVVYPDEVMFVKLEDIAERLNKKFERHWMSRDFVNKARSQQQVTAPEPWKYYAEAKAKILPFCDSTGVISSANTLTKQKFLEPYCWEELLKNTTDPKFDFAKQMQKEGYLDCYVFVSMFHYGIYDQYKTFSKDNKERIRKYLREYAMK